MQPMTLMATGNINCPLLGNNPEFPISFNYNPSPSPLVQNMGPGTTRSDIQPRTSNDEAYATQELSIDVFDNLGINPAAGLLNNNPNKIPTGQNPEPLNNIWGLNENILQWSNENCTKPHRQLNMMDIVIPEEQLTVNIDSDEGGTHSWRPNLTNSLCSDFFLTQPGSDSAAVNRSEQLQPMPHLFIWDSQVGREPVASDSEQVTRNSYSEDVGNYPRIDIQSHLQSQRTQLNCLKYEIINAKRRLHESQATVAKLACELEEKLLFQNSKDQKRLRDENAELRLECQCLCMEVDFYLKGKAPLGEIDETFYRGNASETTKPDITAEVEPQISEQLHYNSEEQEEANKWECPICTFANHPAINSCEMCHMARVRRETTPLHPPSSETCYCHPKEPNFS